MGKLHFSIDNQLQLLHCGQAFFSRLLQEIDRAENEIYLETYIFSEDKTATQIRHVLCEASKRGVKVHVIIDWLGSGESKATVLAKQFTDAGVTCRLFNPWFKRGFARTHRKLCAIDQEVAFVGGINIIDDLFADDGSGKALPFPRWDFTVLLHGELVAQIHQELQAQWLRLGHMALINRVNLMRYLHASKPDSAKTSCLAAFVIRDNLRNRATIQKAYLRALGGARKQAILASPYFAPGRRFRQALISAASRGVQTTLLIGVGEFLLQDAVTRSYYPKLLRNGVKIVEYRKTQLHAKVAVVDENWSTVGSSNVDGLSLFVNHEANLVINDSVFTMELRRHLEQGIADGVQVDLADYINRSWWQRAWYGFAYFIYRSVMRIVTWGGYT
jgi:cardiolipin synthase